MERWYQRLRDKNARRLAAARVALGVLALGLVGALPFAGRRVSDTLDEARRVAYGTRWDVRSLTLSADWSAAVARIEETVDWRDEYLLVSESESGGELSERYWVRLALAPRRPVFGRGTRPGRAPERSGLPAELPRYTVVVPVGPGLPRLVETATYLDARAKSVDSSDGRFGLDPLRRSRSEP